MLNPHFFKAKSRIGLTNVPMRQTEVNIGVEEAPDAILTKHFLQNFLKSKISEFTFSNPEDIEKKDYWHILAKELNNFKSYINQHLGRNEIQIVIGGENTVTFSSLLALIERLGGTHDIGYIQFDSHGEMHRAETSISKNFHGMYMRPFFDTFDIFEIEQLVPQKLHTNQALLIGDITYDGEKTEEEVFQKKHAMRNITRTEYAKKKDTVVAEVRAFIAQFTYLHINFDIDIFHKSVAGATGIPEDGKWMTDEVIELLNILTKHPHISLDLCEVNPKKAGSRRTINLAQKVISTINQQSLNI